MLNSFYNFNEDKGLTSTARNLNSNKNLPDYKKGIQRKNSKRHLSEDEKGYSDISSLSEEDMDSKGYLLDNGKKFNEDEQIINNYYTLESFEKNNLNTNEIMRQGIKDRNDIQHHVIICGMHPEIIHFILPLRAKYLTENMLKWVVILAPMLPQEIYDALSIFPKIIFIQGDPLHPENLFRANITTADIAVILSSNFSNNPKDNENKGNNNKDAKIDEDNDLNDNSSSSNKNTKNKLDEEILDSTTLFIYKSIRKINHSIKIITELLVTKNIEFLLTAKYLKKLYDKPKIESYNNQSNQNEKEKEININPSYEMTPVFASGEIYLPSLVDKIIAQLFFNSNLLDILKLLLEGEKLTMKKKEIKINNLFNLTGSNLFMIPCEIKSESFGEMFKRMLSKNGILCIALYRKNAIDNFYYVYTNPRMTTLIRETDFVFVLSGTENIESLVNKNIFDISINNEEEDGCNNNEINLEENNNEVGKPSIFQVLQESIQKQFNNIKGVQNNIDNNNINNNSNMNNLTINNDIEDINMDNNNIEKANKDKEMTKINNRIDEIKKSIIFSKFKEDENNQEEKKKLF